MFFLNIKVESWSFVWHCVTGVLNRVWLKESVWHWVTMNGKLHCVPVILWTQYLKLILDHYWLIQTHQIMFMFVFFGLLIVWLLICLFRSEWWMMLHDFRADALVFWQRKPFAIHPQRWCRNRSGAQRHWTQPNNLKIILETWSRVAPCWLWHAFRDMMCMIMELIGL